MPATGYALLLLLVTLAFGVVAAIFRSRWVALLAAGFLVLCLAYAGALLLVISQM